MYFERRIFFFYVALRVKNAKHPTFNNQDQNTLSVIIYSQRLTITRRTKKEERIFIQNRRRTIFKRNLENRQKKKTAILLLK